MFIATVQPIEAERITRESTIELNGSMPEVFPLFGPIRETQWAEGWNPEIIFGQGEIEEHMIFKTPSYYENEDDYLWAVSQYLLDQNKIEYTVSGKDRIWFITINCTESQGKTHALIRYEYTGWTEMAVIRNRDSLERIFSKNLVDWEEAISHYLRSRTKAS